jgi:hypothetical protein
MRASFLDQLYLNRHLIGDKVSMMTSEPAFEVPTKEAVWPAPDNLMNTEGQSWSGKAGHTPMLVRMRFRQKTVRQVSPFMLGQVRVVCKPRGEAGAALAGSGVGIYPVGYMNGPARVAIKRLADKITLTAENFDDRGMLTIDFLFEVPNGYRPVLAQFKLNNAAQLPSPLTIEQAPQVIPFGQVERQPAPEPETDSAPTANEEPPTRPRDNTSRNERDNGLSDLSESVVGPLD